ncbi:T9SS type A sorting domain-containing protein [Lacinutrix himadriensis]|uniref:T9SS type A sorting domain-containing protein n=1 Tax=Lacinutrix himadriensis TaxID=641549 RepID=UPI0006E3908B|nr:T9SS type A sorting domain-containing protein [Lacinutrix himadriensis]
MKKNYILNLLSLSLLLLSGASVFAQSVETFEDESFNSSSFTDNGQTFTVSSPTTGENYDIYDCPGCGWNGSAPDAKFLDNSDGVSNNGNNNGSGFTISTGSVEIGVTSFYLYCATNSLGAHSGTLTVSGYKAGVMQYTFTKNSGFSNVATLTPFNGFTFIDLAIEGGVNNTQKRIDQLVITSTGNLDYMALDAFSWAPENTLSVDNSLLASQIQVYPNPSSKFIKISDLNTETTYSIYNILGNKITQGSATKNTAIDIQNFANGLYFLHFENGIIKKFIKK